MDHAASKAPVDEVETDVRPGLSDLNLDLSRACRLSSNKIYKTLLALLISVISGVGWTKKISYLVTLDNWSKKGGNLAHDRNMGLYSSKTRRILPSLRQAAAPKCFYMVKSVSFLAIDGRENQKCPKIHSNNPKIKNMEPCREGKDRPVG